MNMMKALVEIFGEWAWAFICIGIGGDGSVIASRLLFGDLHWVNYAYGIMCLAFLIFGLMLLVGRKWIK